MREHIVAGPEYGADPSRMTDEQPDAMMPIHIALPM
jgi:hypothetical protein